MRSLRGGEGGAGGGGGGVGERALSTPASHQHHVSCQINHVQRTVVDVPVVGDDLLDDRRPDLWLRRWWWGWWGWRGLRRRRALFHAANDYFVLDDFALAGSS